MPVSRVYRRSCVYGRRPVHGSVLWAIDDDLGMGSILDEYGHVVDSADCYHALFNFDGAFGPAVELYDADELDSGTC